MQDETISAPQRPPAGPTAVDAQAWLKPTPLVTRALVVCLIATVLAEGVKFAGPIQLGKFKSLTDFDAFHITARMIWLGRLDEAYHFVSLLPFQRAIGGAESFMPWTYPPTFDLVIAPFGLLPLWLAYLLFLAPTLAAYLILLRRLAGEAFGTVVLALFPAIIVTTVCGQNGFLTATLIGLACVALMRDGAAAGIPLGLMAIKPHLAVCLGFHALATRRWTVVLCAALVVALFCAAATLAFGWSVWTAFLGGVGEARIFLREGLYPMHRMVSVYAFLLTAGLPATIALAGQWLVAATILAGLWIAVRRRMPLRQVLAFCALTSPLLSPYAYDYDLPICGIGLALVMADIRALTTARERLALIGLSWTACGWGMIRQIGSDVSHRVQGVDEVELSALSQDILSISGALLLILAAIVWRILQRDRRPASVDESLPIAPRIAA